MNDPSNRIVSPVQRRFWGHAPAFTLVELLVVLVIISIMGSMVVTAARQVSHTARVSRTRTILAACDSVVQDLYESMKFRPLSIPAPDFSTEVTGGTLGFEILATEAARVRLVMTRDLQRMELPDRHSDFSSSAAPARIWAAASPVLIDTSGNITGKRDSPSDRKTFIVEWNASQKALAFKERFTATTSPSVEHQGAECLFMIMATTFLSGEPAIASIPSSSIGDVDNDGLPEILDGWGRPLGFIRWPVGFLDIETDYAATDHPDDFDPFRADFAYVTGSTTALATDVHDGASTKKPWSMRPLILSAGSDGQFGLALDPFTSASSTPLTAFSYTDPRWNIQKTMTIANEFMGNESVGRDASLNKYDYPDPFLRRFLAENTSAVFPGQVLTTSDAKEQASDNVTNYSLQVGQ